MRVLLIVYDNGSYIHMFPQGTAYLASALRNKNIDVEIYSQDIHHWSEEHLTNHLNNNQYDIVGLGFIGGYYQYRKAQKISKAIKNSINKTFYVIGGHGPAADPNFFIRKMEADVVVIGDGEETIVELAEAVSNNLSLDNVKGIAFRNNKGTVTINEKRKLRKNVDDIALPAYDMFEMNVYRLEKKANMLDTEFNACMISGRGCPYKCNFCYRMEKGFRARSNENIIEEIELLKKNYGVSYIHFSDELLMSSEKRTIEFCQALINNKVNVKWFCSGRLNFATKDVLKKMKEANCVFINYGIESFDDDMLKIMNKNLTTKQIKIGIQNTINAGISPGLNFIFGNIGETKEALIKGVDFLLKYDDHAQLRTIRPVTPYPGSPLYDYAIANGLIKDCEDFYENKHVNSDLLTVNFTDMTDEEFYDALAEANQILLDNYINSNKKANEALINNLYMNKDTSFRGFRVT